MESWFTFMWLLGIAYEFSLESGAPLTYSVKLLYEVYDAGYQEGQEFYKWN